MVRLAAGRLEALGYSNVRLRLGDGSLGWPDDAPYEGIIVTAAVPQIPKRFEDQLAEGGRLILPVGPPKAQILIQVERHRGKLQRREVTSCVFVPLIGEHGWPSDA